MASSLTDRELAQAAPAIQVDVDLPDAGWYDDPAGIGQSRFWDGVGWTDHVATDGQVSDHALPADRARIPAMGGWFVVAGLVGGFGLSTALGILTRRVAPHQFLVRLVPGQFVLWACLVGACMAASRRYGTGDLADDYGFRARRSDIGRGFILSWIGRLASTLVVLPLILFGHRVIGGNTQLLDLAKAHWYDYTVVAVFAIVGAPLVEELFFRGLLLRVLEQSRGPAIAVAGQAIVFGLCHVNVLLGLRNIAVVLSISAFGAVQGMAVMRYRRLGPGIWSHAFFNVVAVLAIAIAVS